MDTFSSTLARFTQQIGWLSLLDILLVAGAFYAVLVILRGTQAVNLMRGVVVLIVAVVVLSGAGGGLHGDERAAAGRAYCD